MTELSDFALNALRTGPEFTLYRGTHPEHPTPVLVLASASLPQSKASILRLEHEHSLKDTLDRAWAARPLALVRAGDQTLLLLEDHGGDPLEVSVVGPENMTRFLRVAVGAALSLGQVHGRDLIHNQVRPSNLLVDGNCNVRLTGFGTASRSPQERQIARAPIAAMFAYMAPEQTGRLNRSVDARSDLYSLGITLYEMLVGAPPFAASDPLEWIHCHVARRPIPPTERTKGIPAAVEGIVLKLLAKMPEDRYQTAAGIEADLRRCLAAWQEAGHIEPFQLGLHDIPDRLLIPEKLYGRDNERTALMAAFSTVTGSGTSVVAVVSGYSGSGKSALVNELHKAVVRPRGLFAAGKFDQYGRDVPYATIAQSFQDLVRQLLGESDDELAHWQQALSSALGPSGGLMVELIPDLARIIGPQPAVPHASPQDAQARFHAVFRRFVGVFANLEHPLVLFLDDMQWADLATRELLERLILGEEMPGLLLVLAHRDNEVDAQHPLMRTLNLIRAAKSTLHEVALGPLGFDEVLRFVADSLRADVEDVAPLAQLVFEKTGGNPFFTIQFVKALAEAGLLSFERQGMRWRWDIDRVRAVDMTDNVAHLMVQKLNRLQPRGLEALKQLACLGHRAQTVTLSMISGTPAQAIHAEMEELVLAGLVLRESEGYSFLHDRVQEAAYGLIADADRPEAHSRIARALLAHLEPALLEEQIFEVVSHFNRGAASIGTQAERQQVAELNLAAGLRAKSSAAYAAALAYFVTGASMLGSDEWEEQYRIAFDLELNRAECEFLTTQGAIAEERLSALALKASGLVDGAAVARLRIPLYTTLDRTDRSIEVGLEYLRQTGVAWDLHPPRAIVEDELAQMWRLLADRAVEQLLDAPEMLDPNWRGVMDVLADLLPVAQFFDNNLADVVLLRMTNLSLAHGNCDASAYAYGSLYIILGLGLGDYRTARRFGEVGCDLVDKRGMDRFKARVYTCLAVILSWTSHVRNSRDLSRRSLEAAKQAGDLTFACYVSRPLVTNLYFSAISLEEVQREAEKALEFARKARFGLAIDAFIEQLIVVRRLRGLDPDVFAPPGASENALWFEEHLEAGGAQLALAAAWHWIHTMQACFLFGELDAAVAAMEKANGLASYTRQYLDFVEYTFYASLICAASCHALPTDERTPGCDQIRAHLVQLQTWAATCPENYSGRATLVAAELARLENRYLDAEGLYDQAIRTDYEQGFLQCEGLGGELASRFYASRGLQTVAESYLQRARSCYLKWGADGKVRQLDRTSSPPRVVSAFAHVPNAADLTSEQLDLTTIAKMAQAVGSEIALPKLIDVVMMLALQNAGADRGILLSSNDGEARVEAEATAFADRAEVQIRKVGGSLTDVPNSIIRYVLRTEESVLLADAAATNLFSDDPYFREHRCRSVLCLPMVKQGKLIGLLYLENQQASHVFTSERYLILRLLASQAAISLENARLYRDLRRTEVDLARAQQMERERIARELHDTLLQSTQGLVFRLHAVVGQMTADDPVRKALESMLDRAEAVMTEGRDRVLDLRVPSDTLIDLPKAFAAAGEELALGSDVTFRIAVEGEARKLRRALRDEAYRIGREALINAFRHSAASAIGVQIHYGDDEFRLSVQDNGIGIAATAVVSTPRPGHWGLKGMHERAREIGGRLSVSLHDSGTEVQLAIPGAVAYRRETHAVSLLPATGFGG